MRVLQKSYITLVHLLFKSIALTNPVSGNHPMSEASLINLQVSNLTLSLKNVTLAETPPDPSTFESATGSVKVYDYGDPLPKDPTTVALAKAVRHCRGNNPEHFMGSSSRTYGSGNVILRLVRSGMRLTWGNWESTLAVLVVFVEQYECVALTFNIMDHVNGYVGGGYLMLG